MTVIEAGSKGGNARAANLTAEQLSAIGQIGGRKGGKLGGKARANALSAKRRSEIARNAATARWHNQTPATKAQSRRKAK